MKICFVSLEQYNVLLGKLVLGDQDTTKLPTHALLSRRRNVLFIVGKAEDHLAKFEDVVPSTWVMETKKNPIAFC